jgi:hypothetical protein
MEALSNGRGFLLINQTPSAGKAITVFPTHPVLKLWSVVCGERNIVAFETGLWKASRNPIQVLVADW